ncbi:uncharacterized protein LOC119390453 isoform X1 [Rhipicephalus sanguineus]|uniref:uncharacterized protein LOC119390453 isoform X1 n=1 Tax=Rhipicephalus sanguineus TaxID=34632 RepID=UPI0018943308|nr:uncharacterized protein LOC119390453 isoform X1 [Rhipicephalus sanguineus]
MPASCCAAGCFNSVLRGKRLFRIPLSEKDTARRQVWLAIINRDGFVPTAGSRLCEDHFEPDQFEQHRADGRKLLKCNAVPTIPGSGTLAGQKNRKKRRRRNRQAPSATNKGCSLSGSVDEDDDEDEEEAERLSESEAAEAVDAAKPAERSSSSFQADALTCKALQIRFAAGQRGYAVVREMCLGFPTELQLRHCVEALPFGPGVLDGLLPALEHKISTMRPEDRHVTLSLDRVAVPPGADPTLGGTGGQSSENALVFTVAGLASCWKQTLGYHLLPESASFTSTALCSALKDTLFQVIEKCETLGLTVDALVTDLSACSLSLWKLCGVSTRPLRQPAFSTRHPCATEQSDDRRLMVLADVTYVTKSIVDAFIENETLLLPRDVVEKHGLPTDRVCFGHIRSLLTKNNSDNLGFVRAVELDCLSPEYTRKDSSVSDAVLNRGTVTGLRCLRAVELLPKEAETTAWFVEQIGRWRSAMASVAPDTKREQRKDVTAFLREFKDTFTRISLASHMQEEGELRMAKVGLGVSTAAALSLHEILLVERKFNCVLLGRGTSAPLLKLLETICPTVGGLSHVDFRSSLHTVCLAQLFLLVRNGGTASDEIADVVEFSSVKLGEKSKESHIVMDSGEDPESADES